MVVHAGLGSNDNDNSPLLVFLVSWCNHPASEIGLLGLRHALTALHPNRIMCRFGAAAAALRGTCMRANMYASRAVHANRVYDASVGELQIARAQL